MNNSILLLHGAIGTKLQMQRLQEALSEHANVYVLDFEGHGEVPSNNPFSIDLFTDNLDAFLSENNIEGIDIFGYSMGGYVALNLAKRNAQKVGKIMTLGTKFAWTPEVAAQEVKMLNPEKIEEKVPKFAQILQKAHSGNNWKEVLQKTANMMLAISEDTFSDVDLRGITNDVMICVGELDHLVTPEESQHVADTVTSGSFRSFENVKHPIETADTHILASSIIQFFQKR